MNTPEIERLVTTALHTHAEDAMNHTDTEARLESLLERTSRDPDSRPGRLAWAAGSVAAATAVAAVVWWSLPQEPDPAVPPSEPKSQAERVATDFVEAYAAFDRDLVASYLAEDAEWSIGGPTSQGYWRLRNRFDEAFGVETELEGCATASRAPDGVRVECPFTFHALHSEELGRGPFRYNVVEVRIRDGQVASVNIHTADASNGFDDQIWNPFSEWITTAHPEDAATLGAWGVPRSNPAEVNRSLRLWERRGREYADAVLAGEAE